MMWVRQLLIVGALSAPVAFALTAAPRCNAAYSSADFNKDNSVDALDLNKWYGDYGVSPGSDADGNLVSNGDDFLQWQRQLGSRTSENVEIAHNPEPATFVVWGLLAAVTGLGFAARRRRDLRSANATELS